VLCECASWYLLIYFSSRVGLRNTLNDAKHLSDAKEPRNDRSQGLKGLYSNLKSKHLNIVCESKIKIVNTTKETIQRKKCLKT